MVDICMSETATTTCQIQAQKRVNEFDDDDDTSSLKLRRNVCICMSLRARENVEKLQKYYDLASQQINQSKFHSGFQNGSETTYN